MPPDLKETVVHDAYGRPIWKISAQALGVRELPLYPSVNIDRLSAHNEPIRKRRVWRVRKDADARPEGRAKAEGHPFDRMVPFDPPFDRHPDRRSSTCTGIDVQGNDEAARILLY